MMFIREKINWYNAIFKNTELCQWLPSAMTSEQQGSKYKYTRVYILPYTVTSTKGKRFLTSMDQTRGLQLQ